MMFAPQVLALFVAVEAAAAPPAPADTPPGDRASARTGSGSGSESATQNGGSAAKPPPAAGASTKAPGTPPRTLDELLGTGRPAGAEQDQGTEAGRSETERQSGAAGPRSTEGTAGGGSDESATGSSLRRALTEQEAANAFQQAVELMGRSAALLDQRGEVGLETQRVQEDVLAKLDLLLRQPPRRGQGSPSPQQRPQPQPQPQQVPNQQRNQSDQDDQAQQQSDPATSEDRSVPRREEALLEQALESSGAEWGNLPERVREVIRQGLRERPSSLYLRLTEDYYRRLAEESR